MAWLWLREGKPITYGFVGAVILVLYGVIPTFKPWEGVNRINTYPKITGALSAR